MIDVRAKVLIASVGGFAALLLAGPAAAEPSAPPTPEPAMPAAPLVDVVPQAPGSPVEGVPHLSSPEALPPGSTMDPSVMAGVESPHVSYLKDLWQAVQSQEISGKDALVLGISQRGMNTPMPAQAPGPNVPITPDDPPPTPGTPSAPAPAAPPAP